MKFLEQHFKLITICIQALIFTLVFSIKLSTCQLTNDVRTTKKTTKLLNENAVTKDDLNSQSEQILIQEKEIDKIKDGDVKKYFQTKKDSSKIQK
jgi:hypothetical protein